MLLDETFLVNFGHFLSFLDNCWTIFQHFWAILVFFWSFFELFELFVQNYFWYVKKKNGSFLGPSPRSSLELSSCQHSKSSYAYNGMRSAWRLKNGWISKKEEEEENPQQENWMWVIAPWLLIHFFCLRFFSLTCWKLALEEISQSHLHLRCIRLKVEKNWPTKKSGMKN